MELRHVYGNTYAAVGATALMPVYKLTDTDIVLMDTGYARLDRSALVNLIEDNGFRLRGIICSHAHFDHTGNVRFLEECFPADVIIPADAGHLDFCGARFGILQLPGHSAGHIGVVTPDGVAYLGDCLIDEEQIAAAKLPTSMFIARDLESKESLRNLRRPAYIIAHKQVLTDICPLIDRNIAFIHDKGRELLEDLEDGMSFDQWIYAFCQRENVRTRNEFKFSIVERNFANFVDWLTDEGKVEVRREFCAKHYFHREK